MTSLEEARDLVETKIRGKGIHCPCCGKWCKMDKRPINWKMVNALYWIYDNTQLGDFVDVPRNAPAWLLASNQHSTLKHWGLVERAPNTDSKKKHSGLWRVTPKGMQAMMGEPIPKYAFIFDDRCYGFDGPMILLKDVKNRFDYAELMRGTVD